MRCQLHSPGSSQPGLTLRPGTGKQTGAKGPKNWVASGHKHLLFCDGTRENCHSSPLAAQPRRWSIPIPCAPASPTTAMPSPWSCLPSTLPPGRGYSGGTKGLSSVPQPCCYPQKRAEGRTCATATCVCCCCCCRSCWRSCIWWWAERGVPRSGSWADEGSSILGDAVRISSGWRQPCKTPMVKQ